ncbi:cation diffusion facilitator family transporter [Wenjunlia tyrosinilytica]|uniref:Cation efflux system protein n=1 Tax=Wenjunlia tyrosinilytica TaxID=1544741 RepID=A0A917ZTC1_9ACTN|nr:cation diffusion facilitator family transporter [Wenjunlia tyrosinilytica]GGO92381.1 cation efflux system protein [Wenjunlia tyrosinilytica]
MHGHEHPHGDAHPDAHGHPQAHGHPHAHEHGHPHEHARGRDHEGGRARRRAHGHPHDRGHDHAHRGRLHALLHPFRPHSHDPGDKVDSALESSAEGLRTLWISLTVLGVTAAVQALVAVSSGSVALLGDTVHNAADALTSLPLAVAFLLGRRAAGRRFTYGYGRAEDLAGIAIVLTIAASAAFAGYEAADRLLHPHDVTHLPAVAAAAVAGFAGNEWVARYRIRTGRRMGSAALVADGMHARGDAFTSLAVLLGAGGAALGWRWADPVVGLAITAAIVAVLWGAAREVLRRLMDAVDPELVDTAESALVAVDGVRGLGAVRLRWIGHRMRAEAEILVDDTLTVVEAHAVAAAAEHALIHAVPRLMAATVHADPLSRPGGDDHHRVLAHHIRAHPAFAHPGFTRGAAITGPGGRAVGR